MNHPLTEFRSKLVSNRDSMPRAGVGPRTAPSLLVLFLPVVAVALPYSKANLAKLATVRRLRPHTKRSLPSPCVGLQGEVCGVGHCFVRGLTAPSLSTALRGGGVTLACSKRDKGQTSFFPQPPIFCGLPFPCSHTHDARIHHTSEIYF
jgi:hypothetical protein